MPLPEETFTVVSPSTPWDRVKDRISAFRSSKHFKLFATLIIVLAVPLTVVLAMQLTDLRQRASGPATPATPPNPELSKHPINFQTPQASLSATDFYIIADGKKYVGNVADVQVHSDPGSASYTTLETIWHENGTEMRMFIYFSHQHNDFWRVSEIRTYDGHTPGDWIYYQGFIGNSLGDSLILPVLDLTSDPANQSNKYSGTIHFENLRLQAFLAYAPSITPTVMPSRTPSPSPTPRLSRLTLKALCYTTSGTLRWEIGNTNSQGVNYSYSFSGRSSARIETATGSGVVAANSKIIIQTKRYLQLNKFVLTANRVTQSLSQPRPIPCSVVKK